MGRPKTRTEVLEAGELEVFRSTFGGATHAYRKLIPAGGSVSYPTFLRAWRGGASAPEVVSEIRDGWENWSSRMMMLVAERYKDPVQ